MKPNLIVKTDVQQQAKAFILRQRAAPFLVASLGVEISFGLRHQIKRDGQSGFPHHVEGGQKIDPFDKTILGVIPKEIRSFSSVSAFSSMPLASQQFYIVFYFIFIPFFITCFFFIPLPVRCFEAILPILWPSCITETVGAAFITLLPLATVADAAAKTAIVPAMMRDIIFFIVFLLFTRSLFESFLNVVGGSGGVRFSASPTSCLKQLLLLPNYFSFLSLFLFRLASFFFSGLIFILFCICRVYMGGDQNRHVALLTLRALCTGRQQK